MVFYLAGKRDTTLGIPVFAASDTGVYYCNITNSIATLLTLTNNDITVEKYSVPETQTLTNASVGSGKTFCYDALQTITVAGSGTTVTFQSGSSVELIAGHSIQLLPGFHAFSGSYAHAHITTTASFCEQPVVSLVLAGPEEKSSLDIPVPGTNNQDDAAKLVIIYPNPNKGNFTIGFVNLNEGTEIRFSTHWEQRFTDPLLRNRTSKRLICQVWLMGCIL